MKKLILLVICTIISGRADSVESNFGSGHDDFIRSHTPPQVVIDGLKEHTAFFLKINDECQRKNCRKKKGRHFVWKFTSLPNYYVKRDIGRILGRELIHACIQKYKLDRITVPQKYLYHIPGNGTELNDNNYWVIAEEVKKFSSPPPFILEDAKQICTLVNCSGFIDFKQNNIVRTKDGKIAIIDSEAQQIRGTPSKCSGLDTIFNYKKFNLNTDFTEDALKHILSQLGACGPLSKKRYKRLLGWIKKQRKPYKWDYVSFFKNLYPQFTKL